VTAFLLRRLAFTVLLVAVTASGALLLARLAPGDATSELVGENASAASRAAERARLGLDEAPGRAWARWAGRAVRLDFGVSWRYGRPVLALVAERARNTLVLAGCALLLATVVGLPLGIASAGNGDTFLFRRAASRKWKVSPFPAAVRAASLLALSTPPLVLALVLAWLAARTGWLPTGGMTSAGAALEQAGLLARLGDLGRHLVVPVLALALPAAATLERAQARAVAQALGEPFVRHARARGIPEARLRWVHAARAGAGPVLALYGLLAGALLSGSFAVELVAAWPGLGRLMYEALLARDVPLVAGCAAAAALFAGLGTLAGDLLGAWADPRVRG
jgi:ABC-type dipeptide/oligopeptide/nickel transport system permease component